MLQENMRGAPTDNEKRLQQQVIVLRQQNQLLALQLAQVKQHQQQLKQLNRTLVQNLSCQNSEPAQTLRSIKLIIDGGFGEQKVLQLQAQINRLHRDMDNEVESRVKRLYNEMVEKFNSVNNSLDIKSEINSSKMCINCLQLQQKSHEMMKQQITLKSEIQNLKKSLVEASRNNRKTTREDHEINSGLRQTIRDLTIENERLRDQLLSADQQIHRIDKQLKIQQQEWCRQLQNVHADHEIQITRIMQDYQQQSNRQNLNSNSKKPHMMKEIQNLVNEINTNRKISAYNNASSRVSKASSRLSSRSNIQSQYADFTIKDAINRPNKGLTFY